MKRKFLKTGDGSITIHLPEWNEQYHSKHGAIAEAKHVFITSGLQYFVETTLLNEVFILEIGFGTGLNAYLSYLENKNSNYTINYTGVEAYPVASKEIEALNYPQLLATPEETFKKFHTSKWEEQTLIDSNFTLTKRNQFFSEIKDEHTYHIIYFDAFGARVQPDLWTVEIFQKMYHALKKDGILVTYSAKGSVRRNMQTVGFNVERLPGPPGKREMLRATKK